MAEKGERYYRAYMSHHSVSRRGLLRGIFGGLKDLPNPSEHHPRTAIRPPHAVVEPLFLERCDGCGACERECPEYVIAIEGGKATLNFDYGYCSGCGKCQLVCDREALVHQQADCGFRPTISEGCQNALGSYCRQCIDVCPNQALTPRKSDTPELGEQCDGCGRCKQACPSTAISVRLV